MEDLLCDRRLPLCRFLSAGLRSFLAIQHIRARHIVLAGAHQGELDLVLDLLDVKCPSGRLSSDEYGDDSFSKLGDNLSDPCRSRTRPAVYGKKRFGHCNRDLGRLEAHNGPVAANDPVLREQCPLTTRRCLGTTCRDEGLSRCSFAGKLHVLSSFAGSARIATTTICSMLWQRRH